MLGIINFIPMVVHPEITEKDKDKEYDDKEESELIRLAIQRHGVNELIESKTLDILASLIAQKFIKKQNNERKDSASPKKTLSSVFNGFLIFLTASYLIFSILYLLKVDLSNILPSRSSKNSHNSIFHDQFEFKASTNLSTKKFFGQTELLSRWKALSQETIEEIYSDRPKEELDDESIYTHLNYLLYGPPGTGKTFFVHMLTKELDFILKENYLKDVKADEYKKKIKEFGNMYQDSVEYKKYINSQQPRIRFCEVLPATINGKYVGESEGNVKKLFRAARKITSEKWKACILFFDEGDVFFNRRSSGTDSSESSALNVKSELLTNIGVVPTDVYRPIFVFTATNRMTEFDGAFKRRFGNQAEFKPFSYAERVNYFKETIGDFGLVNDHIVTLATYTADKSQAYIAEKITTFIKNDRKKKLQRFDFDDYVKFLKQNLNSTNMV